MFWPAHRRIPQRIDKVQEQLKWRIEKNKPRHGIPYPPRHPRKLERLTTAQPYGELKLTLGDGIATLGRERNLERSRERESRLSLESIRLRINLELEGALTGGGDAGLLGISTVIEESDRTDFNTGIKVEFSIHGEFAVRVLELDLSSGFLLD